MPNLTQWFFNYILPYLAISVIGGLWMTFRRVDEVRKDLQVLSSEYQHLFSNIDTKWKLLDEKVKDDINDVRAKLDYIQTNTVTRDELNQYLQQVNITVARLSETLNKLL